MIDVFTLRGAGESMAGPNLLDVVTSKLDRSRFRSTSILYPASIGPVNSDHNVAGANLEQSVTRGKRAIAYAVRESPNSVVLLGYSLGALVVSQFLEDLAAGEDYTRDCHILYAGLVSNPRRAADLGLPGYGIAGEHGSYGFVSTYEVARADDGITCCPAGSPLRRLADVVVMARRPQRVDVNWLRDPIGAIRAYSLASQLVTGYLTGRHSTAYISGGDLDRLAGVINEVGR